MDTLSYFIGITKLAGYSLCLSVIESTIPKSKNTALATILPPIVLGIPPTASPPFEDVQSYCRLSSERRTLAVDGISTFSVQRLFRKVHSPREPSLKDNATGTFASLVMEAQAPTNASATKGKNFFMLNIPYSNINKSYSQFDILAIKLSICKLNLYLGFTPAKRANLIRLVMNLGGPSA